MAPTAIENYVVRQNEVEVVGRIGVTEQEAQAYYESHKAEFSTPASLTLRELMIAVPTDGTTVNVGLDDDIKKKTEAALARARNGESFEALVKELSDSPSKANGGLVGPLLPDDLAPEIKSLIANLAPGDTTEVFRTRSGWAILKVESSTPAQVKTLEQARDDVSQKVYESKRRAEFLRYIQKLRAQAIIDWKNAEMKRIWEERLAAEAKTTPAKLP